LIPSVFAIRTRFVFFPVGLNVTTAFAFI